MPRRNGHESVDLGTIGGRIRSLRESKGETQEDLGTVIERARSTISAYESGRKLPGRNSIVLMAKHYQVPTDYVLHGISGAGKASPLLARRIHAICTLRWPDEGLKGWAARLKITAQEMKLIEDGQSSVTDDFLYRFCYEADVPIEFIRSGQALDELPSWMVIFFLTQAPDLVADGVAVRKSQPRSKER